MSNPYIDISQEQCYNLYMTPRHHFADYMRNNPKEYQTFSDNVWNTFVGVTHTIGLGKFFSFTPEELQRRSYTAKDGRFSEGDLSQYK